MEEENRLDLIENPVEYTDENIRTLSGIEHVRLRPGMYIGKLGDGSHPEDECRQEDRD
jgi:topoisomerase-4 subunit B